MARRVSRNDAEGAIALGAAMASAGAMAKARRVAGAYCDALRGKSADAEKARIARLLKDMEAEAAKAVPPVAVYAPVVSAKVFAQGLAAAD